MNADTSTVSARPLSLPARLLLIVVGSLSLGLGILGAILPLIPATPFLLLTAICYVRAWPRAYRWLGNNRFLGPICRQEGRHLPLGAKVFALSITLVSFGATIAFAVDGWTARVLLALLCLGITVVILRVPSSPDGAGR